MAADKNKVVASLTVAAVAAGVLVALVEGDLGAKSATSRTRLGESKLVELPDAGKGYAYPADLDDGGVEYLVTDSAPCVRRPAGAPPASCLRRGEDGGSYDYGDLNRFPASEAVGAGCEGVACSVVLGENADEPEDARIIRERGRR